MRHPILTTVCAAAALTAFGAIPAANATETAPVPVEGWWAMPDGGTPENVTWDQPVADPAKLDCGVWYQVDLYPDQGTLDGLAADGFLRYGEDHGTVISWRFVYGGDCVIVPEQPADIVTGASSDALDCEGRIYTVTQTETRTTHLYDEATNLWVVQTPVTVEMGSTPRPATEAECPLPVKVAELTTETEAAVVVPVARVLANTGPAEDAARLFAAISAGVVTLVGAALVFITRRRAAREDAGL